MSNNPLYNTISTIFDPEHIHNAPKSIAITHCTHQKTGKKYFKCEIPVTNKVTIGDFVLIDHHLSVYSAPTCALDLKSQYHYTAHFKDQSNKLYRLHVYYNYNDDYVVRPFLSVETNNNHFEPVKCQEQEEAFKVLAQLSSKTTVDYLRLLQKNLLKDTQMQYDELNKKIELLSVDLIKNKKEYLSTIESLIFVLGHTKKFANDRQKISREIIYWNNITIAINKTPESISNEQPISKDKKVSQIPEQIFFKSEPVHKTNKSQTISGAIQSLLTRFDELKQAKDHLQLASISKFYREIKEKENGIELEFYNASVQNIKDLHCLKMNTESLGKSLLQRLIINNELDKAADLGSFFHLLPESIVSMALLNDKSMLLDFLLKNSILPVNFKNFTVKNKQYASLIDFCFNCSDKKTSSKEHLGLLIKNGASLMELESHSGLPFAAILLTEPNHLLISVLKDNATHTLNNPEFYRQLNQILEVLVTQTTYNKEQISLMTSLIKSNREKITLLDTHKLLGGQKFTKIHNEILSELQDSMADELIQQLIADPEIKYLKKAYADHLKYFLSILPKKEQSAAKKEALLNFEEMKKGLNAVKDLDTLPGFDDLKNSLMKQCVINMRAMDLKIELVDVQKQLQTKNTVYRKLSREQNKLLTRQAQLVEELKIYIEHDKLQRKQLNNMMHMNTHDIFNDLQKILDSFQPTIIEELESLKNTTNLTSEQISLALTQGIFNGLVSASKKNNPNETSECKMQ